MNLYYGIKYNIKGLIFSFKSPKLVILGILRFFIVLLLTFVCLGVVLYWHDNILNMIWIMPNEGWLVALWKLVSWLLFLFLGIISMVLAYIIAQLFFCVFIMDYMSRITEALVLGKPAKESKDSWFSIFIFLIKQEIPRAIIPIVISLVIMVLSLVTPVGPVIIIISSVIAATFLAWDNTDLIPARRMVAFKERFGFLKKNILFHIGFGLLFLIPWVNILFLSFAPVGATLYYIDQEAKS